MCNLIDNEISWKKKKSDKHCELMINFIKDLFDDKKKNIPIGIIIL